MGNRLSAIATRTGDSGTTGLGDGSRVSKADARVAAMGEVDELNSAVGMLIALGLPRDDLAMDSLLAAVQQDLLDLGGELSIPGYTLPRSERVASWTPGWRRPTPACLACRSSSVRVGRSSPRRRTCAAQCAGARSAASSTSPKARR